MDLLSLSHYLFIYSVCFVCVLVEYNPSSSTYLISKLCTYLCCNLKGYMMQEDNFFGM